MMDEEEFANDFSSDLTGNKSKKSFKMPLIIISIASIIALIAVLVIIIFIISKKSDKKNSIGEINCIFNVEYTSVDTRILGEDFNLPDLDIYINNEKIKNTKLYRFSSFGMNNVTFKLYENIQMDYMFQNAYYLFSVEMNTNKNAKILSMKNTFENCINLEQVNISNFDTTSLNQLVNCYIKQIHQK